MADNSSAQPPAPAPLAGLSQLTAPIPQDDPGANQPLMLSSSQLSKIGVNDVQPGEVVQATVRVAIQGTPDAPMAAITAIGDIRPDDPSVDLVSLSDAAPEPGLGPVPVETSGLKIPGVDDEFPETPPYAPKKGSSDAIDEEAEEKMLGYKRPTSPKSKPISAKEALGD